MTHLAAWRVPYHWSASHSLFSGAEEAFHDRIVPAVPLAAHRGLEPVPSQRGSVGMRRVLASAGAVMDDQPSLGLPAPYGHFQCV